MNQGFVIKKNCDIFYYQNDYETPNHKIITNYCLSKNPVNYLNDLTFVIASCIQSVSCKIAITAHVSINPSITASSVCCQYNSISITFPFKIYRCLSPHSEQIQVLVVMYFGHEKLLTYKKHVVKLGSSLNNHRNNSTKLCSNINHLY